METIWKFEINGIQISEPVGWDAVILTLQRDPVFHGLENIISDNIKFWDDGGALITAEYDLNGIDGSLNFDVSFSCDGGITFTYLFQGIINCFFYEVINSEVTAKIEPSGFHRKVKNRLSIPINMSATSSLGGQPLSTINPFDLGLHSKSIVKKSSNLENPVLNPHIDSHTFPNGSTKVNLVQFPFENQIEELQTINEIVNIYEFEIPGAVSPDPVFTITTTENGDIRVDYLFKGQLSLAAAFNTFDYSIALEYSYGAVYPDNNNTFPVLSGTSTVGVPVLYNFNFQGFFTVPYALNHSVWVDMIVTIKANGGINIPITFTLAMDSASGMTFKQESISKPSFAKAFLIHEVFAKLAESITDVQDSFRSNFFGRTNSLPHSYDSNGCEAWTAITNGLSIRKMQDKSSNPYPMVLTFQELFDAADAVWNLGMRIEKDSTGKEFIRVEPKEFFYNTHSIFNIFNVSDLKRYPAQDQIFNSFKTGYVKWNLNITGSNALDEFNSDRDYSIPVKNSSTKLSKLSNFIASGYLIEQCRRIQFQSNPTNDFELDNDLFFICTNRTSITSDKYTTPPLSTTYNAGEVSERDENFTAITNVLSPETCYNLRISPVRNAQNWYNYISASTWKHPERPISFINGTGNYQEGDTMINDCVISAIVTQNQNLLASNLHGLDAFPIYLPEYLEFTYPLSYDDFLNIMANAEKAIQVSCSNSTQFIGFIKELKYTPTAQGGEGSFKLLRGACLVGDFNNDFNVDFFMGTCS